MLFQALHSLKALFMPTPTTTQGKSNPERFTEIQPSAANPDDCTTERPGQALVDLPSTSVESESDKELRELLLRIDAVSLKDARPDSPNEEPRSEALVHRGVESAPGWDTKDDFPRYKAFVLEREHAEMLLVNRHYFIVFPNIYVFEQNRIICRIDEHGRYIAVDDLGGPNPPNAETPFYIDSMPYWFDQYGQLWYNLSGQWYGERIYNSIASAREELNRCAQNNQIPAPIIIPMPSSSTSTSNMASENLLSPSSDDEYLYPPFSEHPGREEIDSWFEEFKSRRAALQKTRERVPDIHCPLQECRKTQRRPQALRDHLYFHFDIKPYRCDYGCSLAFETEANKNRHLDSCAYRLHYR